MTVEEMRAIMRRRVVPENLVVQNIVDYLIDDSAQLPQMNAFTFLSRLHELGMESADFLTLLEGCGAPSSVIDKIKANPAMNLHNLVLTLENSELTPDDYSEMLYTARLVWEQTKTSGGTIVPEMRSIRERNVSDSTSSPSEEDEKTVSEIFDDLPEETDDTDKYLSDDEDSPDDEPSFEEIMRHINGAGKSENVSENSPKSSAEIQQTENTDKAEQEKTAENETAPDNKETVIENSNENEELIIKDVSEETPKEVSEAAPKETAKETSEDQTSEEVLYGMSAPRDLDDTSTLIISLDPEKLKKDIEKSSSTAEEIPDQQTAEEEPKTDEELPEMLSLKNSSEYDEDDENEDDNSSEVLSDDADDDNNEDADNDEDSDNDEDDNDDDDEDDDNDDDYDDDEHDGHSARLRASKYHKPALIISAAGAVVLFIICAYMTYFKDFLSFINTKKTEYAENAEEIFAEIYESYTADIIGGGNAQKYFSGEKLFGNYLISQDGFGMYTDGQFIYSAFGDKIVSYSSVGLNSEEKSVILPPESTEFVEIWEGEGSVIAVFTGAECGFMKIENGNAAFTVRQDGGLCDFIVEENEISIGSVYVPHYTKNFKAADVNEYLPRVGKNEKNAMAAENIILGRSSGCSYAVYGKYSLSDGNILLTKAALGDPVYSGAYGICAMNYTDKDGKEHGRMIRFTDEPLEETTEKIASSANSGNYFVTLQGNVLKLYNNEFEELSMCENLSQLPKGMRFESEKLLLNGENGIFSVIDCTQAETPAIFETQKAVGIVRKDSAALFNVDNMLTVNYLKLENGSPKPIGTYTKHLSESELSTLEFGGAKMTAFCSDSCALAYKYFDGVSVVSNCVVFGGKTFTDTLYDDRTGYTAVFTYKNSMIAVSSKGAKTVFE